MSQNGMIFMQVNDMIFKIWNMQVVDIGGLQITTVSFKAMRQSLSLGTGHATFGSGHTAYTIIFKEPPQWSLVSVIPIYLSTSL